MRVGAVKSRPIDVRFIAATNRDLEGDIRRNTFRRDLFFRLNGITLEVPPLRERRAEIEGFALAFAAETARGLGAKAPPLTPNALALLLDYSWPGYIRELRNVMERAVVLSTGAPIALEHLPVEKMRATLSTPDPHSWGPEPPTHTFGEPFRARDAAPRPAAPRPRRPSKPPPRPTADLKDEIEALERARIVEAMERCGGNQKRAAEALGISRRTLVNRLDPFGIQRPRKT
jgi:two-component system, NtrC family, response regulator AtoC